MTDLALLTVEDFAGLTDREFPRVVSDGEPPVSLTLVTTQAGQPPAGGRRPFALTFTGPASLTLVSGIHPLQHSTLGRLDLFVTIVAKDDQTATYEAIFG